MDYIRRMSTSKTDEVDDEYLKKVGQQRRKSSFAVTDREDHPILPLAISPSIEVFPGSVSKRQETLLISPNPTRKAFVITCARTGRHFLTAATSSTSRPGPSHTKHFYGKLDIPRKDKQCQNDERSNIDRDGDSSTKLCTLTRDPVSFRRRHHVDNPNNNHRLLEMEFSTSSWDTGALKAAIEILGSYSEESRMEPIRLRWRGRRASLEGVLEWNNNPAAVCAKGHEMGDGEYTLYVAPGMDLYVCSIIIMAVEDRTRRGSDGSGRPASAESGDGDSEAVH